MREEEAGGVGRVVRREWCGRGKVPHAKIDGKTWHCLVAVVETDKRGCEECYKRDPSCFFHSPIGGSGELDHNVKCEGQVVCKISPSIHLSFKKYLLRPPLGYLPVTFICSEAGALGRGASHPPFQPGFRDVTRSLTPTCMVHIFSVL